MQTSLVWGQALKSTVENFHPPEKIGGRNLKLRHQSEECNFAMAQHINKQINNGSYTITHTQNRFTALLEFVWDYLCQQVPER